MKLFFLPFLALTLISISVTTTSWAMLSAIKSTEAIQQTEQPLDLNTLKNKQESHAPEPTSMALFGSGVFGLIVRFVRRSYDRFKRVVDIIGSSIALILLFPLCALVAFLIKLTSPGPIFFTQTRVGKNSRHFDIYKFRTMKVDAEKYTGPVWALVNDNRITPIGAFLRKTHIDEIPQFLNVLLGEMSVIGPRPERPVFVEQFRKIIPEYEKRIMVKPGITGLAQVWHKYDETIEDVKKKIKYDLLYIKKMCLWTDVSIIFRTFRVVITGEGAR